MRLKIGRYIGALILCTLVGTAIPAKAADTCHVPRMLIVLDKSSSMVRAAFGNSTIWDNVEPALSLVLNEYQQGIDFGLNVFPYPDRCNPGQVVVDVGPNNANSILGFLDTPPPSSGNFTPLMETLEGVASYLPLQDPDIPAYVLLITDGEQWCSDADSGVYNLEVAPKVGILRDLGITTFVVGLSQTVNPRMLANCAIEGGTARHGCDLSTTDGRKNCYYHADNPAEFMDALDSVAQQVFARPCSNACGDGVESCVNGLWSNCTAPQPQVERCDGRDNDCNGIVDDVNGDPNWCECPPGETRRCGSNVGECLQGMQVCDAGRWSACIGERGPSPEVCDGRDNDCNGLVDDVPGGCGDCMVGQKRSCGTDVGECVLGEQRCLQGGVWGGCEGGRGPRPEMCNGLDDDCDGVPDNDLSRPCNAGCEGEDGIEFCREGRWTDCNARAASEEICDGMDNDCNGIIDDVGGVVGACECLMGDIRPCGTNVGECEMGEQECQPNGTWGSCRGGQVPQPEDCDGRDNNCDGIVDNVEPRDCSNACGPGEQVCNNGSWDPCSAPQGEPEICDGIDNNCDGQIDEGADLCEEGFECLCGGCSPPCVNGECYNGGECIFGYCVVDHCPPGYICLEDACVPEAGFDPGPITDPDDKDGETMAAQSCDCGMVGFGRSKSQAFPFLLLAGLSILVLAKKRERLNKG